MRIEKNKQDINILYNGNYYTKLYYTLKQEVENYYEKNTKKIMVLNLYYHHSFIAISEDMDNRYKLLNIIVSKYGIVYEGDEEMVKILYDIDLINDLILIRREIRKYNKLELLNYIKNYKLPIFTIFKDEETLKCDILKYKIKKILKEYKKI